MSTEKIQENISELIQFVKHHPMVLYGLVLMLVVLFVLFLVFIRPKKKKGKRAPLLSSTKVKYKRIAVIGFITLFLVSVISLLTFNNKYDIIENPLISKSEYVFGIDISHYQGIIDWEDVQESKHPIQFVFIRASMGKDGKDKRYERNWRKAKKNKLLRGAYHYYRPEENSTQQFTNFVKYVQLEKGDFPPVLDIEEISAHGIENLKKGILNWLALAEKHYKVKPILYTGRTFYLDHLKGEVEQYPLWIAAYSGKHRLKGIDWTFHQFTEEVSVKGIPELVDGNDFKGTLEELKELTLK